MVVLSASSTTASFNSGSYTVFVLFLLSVSPISSSLTKPFYPNPVSGILGSGARNEW